MGIQSLVVAFLIVALLSVGAAVTRANHDRTTSPRDDALKYLQKQGCTNRVICIMVIEAYKSGTGAAVLMDRLSGMTAMSSTKVSAWISALVTYEATAKVKI
jgi:hypothetical protein